MPFVKKDTQAYMIILETSFQKRIFVVKYICYNVFSFIEYTHTHTFLEHIPLTLSYRKYSVK